jgi:CheY-like chemotaxis protein
VLANGGYDAILMDCQMPRMDGFQATRLLRERERATHAARVPVIALTANAMTGDRDECLAAGMDDYLSKPFTSTQLLLTLSRWLPAAPAAPAEGSQAARSDAAGPEPVLDGDSALDPRPLDAIRALNPARADLLVRRVTEAFLQSAPDQLAALARAASGGDAGALRREAHSLKSSSANLGALRLAALAREIEARGREQRLDDASLLVERAAREFERVREALAAVVGGRRPLS